MTRREGAGTAMRSGPRRAASCQQRNGFIEGVGKKRSQSEKADGGVPLLRDLTRNYL